MMTIGLICEGVSEINIMTRIISKYFDEEPFINPIEPETRLENGHLVQEGYGGWQQVLSHCNDETIEEILQFNDVLIIQIDTDASIQAGYDVSPFDAEGKAKDPHILYEDVKNRLKQGLSHEMLEKYANKILFAICINEIECWLLPLYYTDNNKCKTQNCIFSLNRALARKNLGVIPEADKNGSIARTVYNKILKNLKNKRTIEECAKNQYSFESLLRQLDLLSGEN